MSDSRCDKAIEKKHNGYNCAQAVACAFCEGTHMNEKTLFNLTQASEQDLELWMVHVAPSQELQLLQV